MRKILTYTFTGMLALAPLTAMANGHAKKEMKDQGVVGKTTEVVKTHPGKSAAVVACGVAIAFFPPALLVCGGAAAGGVTVDEVNKGN